MNTAHDAKNEMPTPMIVTQCAPARPIALPKSPATIAATSGTSGMTR